MKYSHIFLLSIVLGTATAIFYFYLNSLMFKQTITEQNITSQFSLENAPSNALKGNIISQSGSVNLQSRIATMPAQLKTRKTIQQGDELTTDTDGTAIITIPKATSITLSPNSDINFIQTLPANIVIEQNQGTSDYQKSGTIPVSIHSLDLLIDITSGDVLIATDPLQQTITVSVKTGSVMTAYTDLQNVTNTQIVIAGNQFIFHNDTKQAD